jgi:hypothetical protein
LIFSKRSRHRALCGKVTELLRRSIYIALTLSACADFCAFPVAKAAHPSANEATRGMLRLVPADTNPGDDLRLAQRPDSDEPPDPSGLYAPDDIGPEENMTPAYQPPASLDDYSDQGEIEPGAADATDAESRFSKLSWLGLRHSSVNGRNAGMGVPLVGTSWLNRPYYIGADLGTIWITHPPLHDLSGDSDIYGGVYAGCDLDYYWGAELAVQRATPELVNGRAHNAARGDRMMLWTANLMYYPWGDSLYRPYWRCGIGEMEIDFPNDAGVRRDETLWAFPIGIGIKYPLRRWLAARAEFADQIGIGNSGVATQHDLTLTFALEWRLGARPRSYWPWNPSRHIW